MLVKHSSPPDLNHAIVIGGSIAGLLSARVLSEYFSTVTIVETDTLPKVPAVRKGVSQSPQPHILFAKGYRILNELFPDLERQLHATGALPIDWAREFYFFNSAGWSQNATVPSDIISFTCSRPLLEWAIRQSVIALPNVQFIEHHRTIGLLMDGDRTTVTGIQLNPLQPQGIPQLLGDLVIDTSGRRSNAPKWLKELGLPTPPETVIDPFLGYATRRYQEPPGFQANWKVMLISQQPPHNPRLGYLARIEDGEWIATLGGYGRDFPPLDEVGFLNFARSLPSKEFYDAITAAEPVSRIYAYRATANRLRHYEKIPMPQGFISLGDAVCALCPVYGQGMTVSALSAVVLREWLHASIQQGKLVSSQFQRRLAKSNAAHWMLATQQDSQFTTTANRTQPNWLGTLVSWYSQQIIEKTSMDAELYTLFMETAQLLKSPLALYHPNVMRRVFTRHPHH